nr:thioredoxin-like protein [Raoultella sp. NCTC 9187]
MTIEREQKRVKQLQPGASAQFDLTYTLLHNNKQVAEVEQRIAAIQGDAKVAENDAPIAKE